MDPNSASQHSSGWKGSAGAHQVRLPRIPCNLALNASTDGTSPAPLGGLCQGLATIKKILMFDWDPHLFSLKPLPWSTRRCGCPRGTLRAV